jgi:hypothetical protein
MLPYSKIPHASISQQLCQAFIYSLAPRGHIAPCVGRALFGYNLSNCAISAADAVTGCFNTNQVTFSLQGGVVSDAGKL